jgi:hypothetical protein
MARIIVISDSTDQRRRPAVAAETPVLLDERVEPVHLRDSHAAGQLIERLAWAVSDAEDVQRARSRVAAAAA